MSRRPSPFKQVDVTRALKGVKAAGVVIGRLEIDKHGTIVIVTSETPPEPQEAYDRWKAEND